jgi:hypothetical protein
MDEILDCARAVAEMMRERGLDRHSIEVLQDGLTREMQGLKVDYERLQEGFGRRIDSITSQIIDGVTTRTHTETKTGYDSPAAALSGKAELQILKDASIALDNFVQRELKTTTDQIQNVWRLVDHAVGPEFLAAVSGRMSGVMDQMKAMGLPPNAIKSVLESFKFVDKAGDFLKAEVNSKGELMFRDAMGNLFDANGKLAQAAEKATGSSPDFGPAMNILFGSSGKVAHAAQDATGATNLDAAMHGLEQKVESGVTSALDEAGTKAQAAAASKLGANIKEGVGALGNSLSSIGGLGTSVLQLGEAWNKPKKGAADYFALMSQLGGTISQGLGAVDAIGKLGTAMSSLGITTKIAAAAQALFNAIMAINPVVLIVIGVLALIAAIVLLIVYWDEVKAALRDNPWLAVVAALFGVIGVIVLVIAYWDEIKLAVLIAANFMSIQVQKIGGFFVGLKNLIGMVWDWITASVYNLGAGILNVFIEFGAGITNTFIDLLNGFIDIYNDIAAWVPGLDEIANVERVDVEKMKVATKAVPEIDVGKAFAQGEVKGGLEDQIAKQEQVVKAAQAEDKARQDKAAADKAAEEKKKAAEAPPAGPPALPAGFGGAPAGPTGEAPAIPAGALGAGVGGPDQSVHVEGGIHVTINAEGLDGGSAKMLTDDMVRQIQDRLDSLRSERDRRVGVRNAAAA